MEHRKILIVEDNPDARLFLRAILRAEGYDVIEAKDGEEAVAKAINDHPELILMDLMLPVLDGLEATKRLTTSRSTRDIPIVAVTAYAGLAGMTKEAMEAGCVDCLPKPIELSKLQSMVERWLSQSPGEILH